MRLRSRTALPLVVLLVGCWAEGNEPPVVHFNGMSGFYQPEAMGPVVAMFDYDNDGDLGVYLVQGQTLGTSKALLPPPNGLPRTDRLCRNHVEVRRGGMRLQFTDLTDESGIETRGYGMGVATRDIDNDGDVDVLVGNDAGPVRLLVNSLGDGNHGSG